MTIAPDSHELRSPEAAFAQVHSAILELMESEYAVASRDGNDRTVLFQMSPTGNPAIDKTWGGTVWALNRHQREQEQSAEYALLRLDQYARMTPTALEDEGYLRSERITIFPGGASVERKTAVAPDEHSMADNNVLAQILSCARVLTAGEQTQVASLIARGYTNRTPKEWKLSVLDDLVAQHKTERTKGLMARLLHR